MKVTSETAWYFNSTHCYCSFIACLTFRNQQIHPPHLQGTEGKVSAEAGFLKSMIDKYHMDPIYCLHNETGQRYMHLWGDLWYQM